MLKSLFGIAIFFSVCLSPLVLVESNQSFDSTKEKPSLSLSEKIDSIGPLLDRLNELHRAKKSDKKADDSILKEIKELKKELKTHSVKNEPKVDMQLRMMDPKALCPEIQTIELINVAGFASTDRLVVCGDPDTLAYVVYIEEPGDILGAQMSISFQPGMQYAGFELTHYGGTTISNLDPDPIKPKFLLEGITDAVFIAYIGVESTCDANVNGLSYTVDLEYNFTYQDTFGNIQTCRQKAFPARVYNSTIKTPVLNYRSTPVTTISSLSEEYCTTIQISQDGIQAYLKDFDFAVCGLDLENELSLTSTSVNGIPIGSNYDPSDSTLTLNIDDSYFPPNLSPNPADNYFDENEKINIQFCYEVTDCPTENTQFITYKASWGCNDEYCMSINKASEIRIRPTKRPNPYTTVEKLSNPGVCGDPGIIELVMYAAEPGSNVAILDSAAGLFTDIRLGYETCDQSSLGVTAVNFGATSLPASSFSWDNGDLIIDFQTLTSDPDGPGGITDADGDGFYDDLPGGETLTLQVELEFLCELPPDPSSIACSSVDCSFAKFFVQAKRDCGQSFKIFPDIEEFNIVNGATYVELKGQTLINNNFYGYDFGVVGNNGACNPLAAKTRTIEFCYIYERENVEPCPAASTTNELQVVFTGSPIAVYDIQFVPGSGELSVNGVTTSSGATGTFTDIAIDKRVMNLALGNPNVGDEICYKYQLVADTAVCAPPQYMVGTHQVIETCDTGTCKCVTVKACDATEIRIDPTDCGCTCDIASGGSITRWNLGYTDETMTEKIDREDVPVEDLSRFLPCDTILYEGWMKLLSPETVRDLYQLYFVANISNLGYNGWRSDETELMIDASGSELLAIEFSKEGSAVRQNVDFSKFTECYDMPGGGSTGFWAYAAETPWDEVAHAPMCNSSYEHHDGNLIGFYLRNFDLLEDCRGTEVASWEESNCLQQFMEEFDVEVGDSIHMRWLLPLTKNVKAHARKEVDPTFTFAPPQILNVATGHYIDEFDNDCLVYLSNCRENTPFSTFCPNGINAITDMEVDDCGGSVMHEFNVIESTPVNWYTKEYRPFFNMQDITVPIHTPMMYCGNARLVTSGGVEYPLEVTEFTNHTCATVGTEEYCSVSSGDVGMLTFNLEENGYPGMGVGLGGITDGFTIEYDLCRVCPVELADLSEYEINYDYKICEPLNGTCFRCWVRADGTYVQMTEICSRDGSTPVGHNQSYYDFFDADRLFIFSESSEDFNVTDVSNGFPPLTQDIDRLIMASDSPGSSVEMNTIEICADGTDPDLEIHKSVLGSVTVTNSLALSSVYDASMNPIPFNFVSSTGGNSTYSFPMDDLAPGDCVEIILGTTLLYCPEEPEVAEACLTVTSGCLDRDVLAAVVGNASNCNTSTSCYRYVTEESDIQANFLSFGDNLEYPLCGEIPLAALVKNVQVATLTDLALTFDLPLNGATIVPGSFMASYPNSGDLSGATPFYTIPDPIVNGNILSYPEDAVFSNHIHTSGFPGVLSSLDSNYIVVKFLIKTDCDEFLSGSFATFEATAIDPCSPDELSTGVVNSEEMIVQDANPNDFAKILVTAKPSEAFCGQSNPEFKVTGLNISEKPSGDSLQMCITLPNELAYVPGSMAYVIPSSQSVGTETITMIGSQTQVCFAGYNNMPVGGQFTLRFEANFDEDTPCGDYKVGVDIKELRPSQICEDGGVCDVFVQSSVNPEFTVTLKGPLETAALRLTRTCDGGEDPVTLCYEADLNNPGSDYSGTVTVNLHEDLNSNGLYDFFDPIIGTMDFPGTFALAGESVTLNGCFEVPLAKSCPVILNVVYETECNCDNSVSPFTEIVPGFTVDLPSTIYLCPGEKLALDTCSNYTIVFDPPSNVTTESTSDSLYICLVDPAIETEMTLTGFGGDCTVYEPFKIQGIEDLDLVLAESETCQNVPLTLEPNLPSKYHDFVDITWTPASNLDDPNILDPIFLSDIPGDYTYNISMVISESCSIESEVTVTVLPNGEMGIAGDTLICFDYSPGTLTSDAGYDTYEWYRIISGFEIIQASTSEPSWTGPLKEGKYIVKGFSSTKDCPSVSDTLCLNTYPCSDLEVFKSVTNIPDPFYLGSQVTYEIVVCNINDPDIGMIFDVENVELIDQLPGGVTYVSHTHTDGSYSPGSNEWDLDVLESGTCDTLWIDVTVDEYDCIINDAQVTTASLEDVDSTPNNDDGDQSEDDEANAKVQVDTFDLALTKKLNPMQTIPVTIGSTVTYDIQVCNQGDIDAYNVQVVDYVPAGMMVTDPNWTVGSSSDEYFRTIGGPITPGNCETISLIATVTSIPASGSYINYAEIDSAEDKNGDIPPDVDSNADNDPGNDGPVTDDNTSNENGDEDDHDPATIPVIMVDCMISSNSTVCIETPLMMEEIGMDNTSWSWSGPAGYFAMTQSVTINPPVAGTYTVTVTDSNGLTSSCEVETSVHPEMQLTVSTTDVDCKGNATGKADLTVSGGSAPFTYDWSNDGADDPDDDGQDVMGLEDGAYTVTVTDRHGCTSTLDVMISEPDLLECRLRGDDLKCNGDESGKIYAKARGGLEPYSYSVDGGPYQPGDEFSDLNAGTYTVTVKDANGCTTECEIELAEPELLSCTVNIMDSADCSADNGAIEVIVAGGTAPFSYSLNSAAAQPSSLFEDLSPGEYILSVIDANGCATTCSATILEPGMPACEIISAENVTCNMGTDGSLTATATGGSGNYEYSLDGMTWQSSPTFNELIAGAYTVTVRNMDSPNCMSSCSVVLTEPTIISCALTATEVSCNGLSDATITVTPSGGLGNYDFTIDDGLTWQTTTEFTGLQAGTYTVTVRDNGDELCTSECNISIIQPDALSCSMTTTAVLCNGEETGTLTVTTTGGTTPYEYSLDGGPWQPGNAFADLAAGDYTVTTRDKNGCLTSCSSTVKEPALLTCSTSKTDVTDCETTDGTVTVTASGGVGAYQYSIDGGSYQASNSFTGLMAGTHLVSVRDANNCVSTCEVTLDAPAAPMCSITSTVNIACMGEATGSVTVSGTGGTAPYEFSLDNTNWQAANTFAGLTAGMYTIYIRNSSSTMCMSMCAIELTEPLKLSCTIIGNDVICKNGSTGEATVSAVGGVAPYSYLWSNGQTSFMASGLVDGTYMVTVTDDNGCSTDCEVTISEPEELTCTLTTTSLNCNGDGDAVISVSAMGGIAAYEYSLNGSAYQPGSSFSDLDADDYVVTVRDDNNCEATCALTITEPEVLSCSTSKTDVTDCLISDGTITISVTGGTADFSYSIDGGVAQSSNTFNGLGAGTHLILVTDENGCTTNCEATIDAPSAPMCQITFTSDISCKDGSDGSISIIGTGGSGNYEYSINGGAYQISTDFTGLTAGDYTITVRNIENPMCTSTCFASLTEPELLICSTTSSPVSCKDGNDGQAMVIAQGGTPFYAYLWSNGSTSNTANNLSVGMYTVTVTDTQGCTTSCTVDVSEPTPLAFTTTVTDISCNGEATGQIFIVASGATAPYDYSLNGLPWQPGNIYVGLEAGTYVVTVRDNNNCVLSDVVTISEPTPVSCSIVSTDVTNCGADDGTLTLSGVGGTPGYEYSLNGGSYQSSNSFTGLMPGTHTVTIKDSNDCTSSCEAFIDSPTTPFCQIANIVDVECYGEATGVITTIGSGGTAPYEFSIDNLSWQASGTFSDLGSGIYSIYIRNNSSPLCVSMCSAEIEQPEELHCQLLTNDPLCFGGDDGNLTVLATEGTPGYEFSLDGGPWQPSPVFFSLTADEYEVTIRDDNGCTITCSTTINEPALLECTTTTVDLLCNGDASGMINVSGAGGVAPYDYNINGGFWQDGSSFTGLSGGDYIVYIRDEHDCVSSCNATINEPPLLECNLVEVMPESCVFNDGRIEVVASGGSLPISYSIDGGSTSQASGLFSGLTLGTYTITIVDANGCIVSCEYEILPDCFDLALTKKLVTSGPYTYGQNVVFDIEVINQGNIDATNIEVTDHLPCGFSYDPSLLKNLANNWTLFPTAFPMTTINSIPAQSSKTVQIEVKVEMCTEMNGHVNVAEISEAYDGDGDPIDDVDSNPDFDPDNDSGGDYNGPSNDQEDGDGTDDEDDHDPEFVPIFDVALEKELVTEGPYAYGQLLEFAINVCNQSSPVVTDVAIVDHIPVGYSYNAADNPGWTRVGSPTPADVEYTIAGPIAGGGCVSVPIFLTLEMAGGVDDWKNTSEVTDIKDENGDDVDDVDSDESNDDGDQSEDDEDFAGPEVIDAALVKTTTATGPFAYGDVVTYDITIYNQGNVTIQDIVVNDFLPCGHGYLAANAGTWSFDSGTSIATTTVAGPITPGSSSSVSITIELQACNSDPSGAWTNVAEIESFSDEDGENITDKDIDSDADDDPDNDVTDDNTIDNSNGDEDDNDPETIEIYDLAQIKQLISQGPFAYGDLLEYNICVINQGNVTAHTFTITDHLPTGLSFGVADNPGWDASNAPAYDYVVTSPLAAGDTICIPKFVTFEMTSGGMNNYQNISEISADDGEDADSDEDDDPDNDGDPTDDSYEDEEDDHDPENFEVVDLALNKTATDEGPFSYGDAITFDINIFNQGNVDMYNVLVNDFIPCGFEYVSTNDVIWTYDGSSIATTTIAGPIVAGGNETVSITLTLKECVEEGAWKNIAEIESMQDEDGDDRTDDDVDSDGDDDPDNDGEMEDDATDGENGDEDDSDFEEPEIFDLALIKTVVTPAPYALGQDITFNITIVNQGNVPATDILISEYMPAGFIFDGADNPGWDGTNAPTYEYTVSSLLIMGDTITIPFIAEIQYAPGGQASYTNASEIGGAKDESGEDRSDDDADSDPDDDPDNDGDNTGVNDNDFDDGDNGGEDDYDEEVIYVVDVALVKTTLTPGDYTYGQAITFEIEVFNQGVLDLYDVVVNDFLPCGFKYLPVNNSVWSFDPISEVATTTIDGPIKGQSSEKVTITLELVPCEKNDAYRNTAEVESMKDEDGDDVTDDDIDSKGDDDPDNDGEMEDNSTDGTNGDEDDSDFEDLQIFDLALIKELVTAPMYEEGDTLEYRITVVNQGNVAATNIVVHDHLPVGLVAVDALNIGWSSLDSPTYTYTIGSVVEPGDVAYLNFYATIDFVSYEQEDYTNYAEIGAATDNKGDTRTDADSDPDDDPNNDGNPIDDQLNDKGDEDDHDPETFDLIEEFIPPCNITCEMNCIGQINLSLDENCEATLQPNMLIPGLDESCNMFVYDGIIIEIFDEDGNRFEDADGEPINMLDADQLDMNLTFSITNNLLDPSTGEVCGNTCWGNVLVEYKYIPQLDCPDPIDLSCGALDVIPLPVIPDVETCLPLDFEVRLINEEREVYDCHDDYTATVTRTYGVIDAEGNIVDVCTRIFNLLRIDLSNVQFPPNAVINCSSLDSFYLNAEDHPIPWLTAGSGSQLGVPFICEVDGPLALGSLCPVTGSGSPLIPQSGASMVDADGNVLIIEGDAVSTCSAAIMYTDIAYPDIGCTKKFIRQWEIREWWCGAEIPMGGLQQIEIIDDEAPDLVCPDDITVTTDDDCAGSAVLPPAQVNDACGNGEVVTIEHPWGIVEGNGGEAALEVGSDQIVTYKVRDECYNFNECTILVTVRDNTEPVAICEASTVVSISQDGNTILSSHVFDDGSWDECSEVTSCAMRMEDQVRFRTLDADTILQGEKYVLRSNMDLDCVQEYVDGVILDGEEYLSQDDLCVPYVRFCCNDVGQDVMVVFRALDKGGNHSDCMVNVEVQDKSLPILTCPSDVTVDCHTVYDLENLDLTFGPAVLSDNCESVLQIEEQAIETVNQCRVGSITRNFSVSDLGLLLSSCKQFVTIEGDIYNETNIVWPTDLTLSNQGICDPNNVNPLVLSAPYKEPTFPGSESKCSLLGHDFEDKVVGDGECFTILRTWKVIDWCNQVDGTFLIYEMPEPQEIKVLSTEASTIELSSNPIVFTSSDLDCINGDVNVTATSGSSACAGDLDWSYVIRDLGNNVIRSGAGNNYSGSLVASNYTIEWTVINSCGLTSVKEQELIVRNTKFPIPVCMSNMVLELNTGSATLEPSMIDVGSYSPCNNPIALSFSSSTTDVTRIFDCDDLGNNLVELWITDVNSPDVQDFCIATIMVEDGDNSCLVPGQRVAITGQVFTETYQDIEDVQIYMDDSSSAIMTDEQGEYAFNDMPLGGAYDIVPEKDDDDLNGVSTLDLILIQRHILGLDILESPYQLIAADINSNKNIDGVDLVELRKLILGIYEKYPENTSWRFVDVLHEFPDESDPWFTDFPENYTIPRLDQEMEIDFIGVKIGDVNGSVETDLSGKLVDGRSQRWPLVFDARVLESGKAIEITVQNYEDISGWQTTIELPKSQNLILDQLVVTHFAEDIDYHYDLVRGSVTISCAHDKVQTLSEDESILRLEFDEIVSSGIDLSSSVTNSEAYRNYQVVPLKLKESELDNETGILIAPNPWVDKTILSFDMQVEGEYRMDFFDVSGKLIYTRIDIIEAGRQEIELSAFDLEYSGVIYINILTPTKVLKKKMLKFE